MTTSRSGALRRPYHPSLETLEDRTVPSATVGAFEPSTGTWFLRNSLSAGTPAIPAFRDGGFGWIGVMGDWDGDSRDTVGVADPTGRNSPNLVWYLRDSNSAGAPDYGPFEYGHRLWVPVVGDWDGDDHNKLIAGQDALAARPTLLLALALEGAPDEERHELLELLGSPERSKASVSRLRQLFRSAAAFAKAEKLVEKYRERAEAIADEVEPPELRELLYFLIDTVLEREPAPPPLPTVMSPSLPIVQPV